MLTATELEDICAVAFWMRCSSGSVLGGNWLTQVHLEITVYAVCVYVSLSL